MGWMGDGGSAAGPLTAACAVDEHGDCAHRMRLGAAQGPGGPTVELCGCPCHSRCPLAGPGRAGLDAWRESCVCPGGGRMRAEEDRLWEGRRPEPPPDLGEVMREMPDRRAARREVVEAVHARSGGKSHPEIRQMLIGEFQLRGLAVPPESDLDRYVELIAGDLSPLVAVRQIARAFGMIRSAVRDIGAMFRDAQELRGFSGMDAYFVLPDRSRPMVGVVLGRGAGQLLRACGEPVPVSLEPAGPAGDGPAAVRVYVGSDMVGALSPQDGLLYRRALQAAERLGQTLMVMSEVSQGPEGTLQMQIYPAGTGRAF